MNKKSWIFLVVFYLLASSLTNAMSLNEQLINAIIDGKTNEVRTLLDAAVTPNIIDQLGFTPLFWAVRLNRNEIVKMLLAADADPNVVNMNGHTPLHIAAAGGNREILDMLFEKDADPLIKDKKRKTPADMAKTPEIK